MPHCTDGHEPAIPEPSQGRLRLRERIARRDVTRIGLFSGSFDPPHLGHVSVVERSLDEGLDHVIVFFRPDTRDVLVALEHRLRSLQVLLDESLRRGQFTIWDPAYPGYFREAAGFRSLLAVLAVEPDMLTVVGGEDSGEDDLPDFLAPLRHLLLGRPGFAGPRQSLPPRARRLSPVSEASSTTVRAALWSGGDGSLLPTLRDYIHRENLYPRAPGSPTTVDRDEVHGSPAMSRHLHSCAIDPGQREERT